jgi:hypothetical protein
MQSPNSRRSLLNYIGIFILLAGMGVGEFSMLAAGGCFMVASRMPLG